MKLEREMEMEKTGGVVENHVGCSTIGSGSGGGGKRFFSTFAGNNLVGPRSLPINGNTMPSPFTPPALLPPTFFTSTARPFVHHSRAPHTGTLRMAPIGRFLARLCKW